ncbi:hypothetical protein CIPAW_09G151900 [Carya illinoinensis]|uniref:Uncharacterized protein n=1 Tax=Carya illinoinensis TaxID=32201 RepID=A0A8T1PEF3_CARIL|nr:hypothetical protein CIPAW_09G151900 [Carya illinoinensis]
MICETGFLGSDCLVSVLDLGRTDVVLALGLQSLHHFGLYVLQGLFSSCCTLCAAAW